MNFTLTYFSSNLQFQTEISAIESNAIILQGRLAVDQLKDYHETILFDISIRSSTVSLVMINENEVRVGEEYNLYLKQIDFKLR